MELRLRALFAKVHREKPESSRSVRSYCIKFRGSTILTSYPGIQGRLFRGLKAEKRVRKVECIPTRIERYLQFPTSKNKPRRMRPDK